MNEVVNRLITERDELQEKIDKLISFTYSELFDTLDPVHARLLSTQCDVMSTYIKLLNLRIDLLKETNNVQ